MGDYLSCAESNVVTTSRSYLNQIYSFYVGICCFSLEFCIREATPFFKLMRQVLLPSAASSLPLALRIEAS